MDQSPTNQTDGNEILGSLLALGYIALISAGVYLLLKGLGTHQHGQNLTSEEILATATANENHLICGFCNETADSRCSDSRCRVPLCSKHRCHNCDSCERHRTYKDPDREFCESCI
jgi:hypothetical protein